MGNKRNIICGLMVWLLIHEILLASEEKANLAAKAYESETALFSPIVVVEAWSTYSIGEKKGDSEYANRLDHNLRRMRFGGKGQVLPWLKYSFMFHYDKIAEDPNAATKGSFKGLELWNAYITAQLLKNSELLQLHAGYYWAAISREYCTIPWSVSSFDKTQSVWYLRCFLTGKSNGIDGGIGFGGLKNYENTGFQYRFAIHDPTLYASPKYANPLISGRFMFTIGDPEQTKYSYMFKGNQWRKRKGITIGTGAAFQGKTDNQKDDASHVLFDYSTAFGADFLINYGGWALDGEFYRMIRDAEHYLTFTGNEWHLRLSHTFEIHNYFFEPSVMLSKYKGSGDLFRYIGTDEMFDVGVNWYLKKDKVKVSLHYVLQDGNASSNVGDYVGAAFQLKL